MTPTNSLIWPIVWRKTLEREREAGQRYVRQLAIDLANKLGLEIYDEQY